MRHYERTDSTHAVIAGNLRTYRKAKQMTQGGLAGAAGISRATVAATEGGRYSSLTLATLERLAKALGVDVVDLLSAPAGETAALKRFKSSSWFNAVRPDKGELARLQLAPQGLWGQKQPSPATLADLVRILRQHDTASESEML